MLSLFSRQHSPKSWVHNVFFFRIMQRALTYDYLQTVRETQQHRTH